MTRSHAAVPLRTRPRPPRQTGDPPYRIHIRGLAARTIIGVRAHERRKRQDVTIDVELVVTSRAGRTDRIQDAVDYKRVKDAVLDVVETSRFHLLEAMAEAIAQVCLRHPGVQAADVVVDKPAALRFARSVAVQVRRERA